MGFFSPLNCSRLKLETHWLSGDWGNCSELANDLLWNDTMQETIFLLIIFSHSIFLNQTHSWKKWTLKERDYLSALGKSIIWVTYLQSSARWLHLFTLFFILNFAILIINLITQLAFCLCPWACLDTWCDSLNLIWILLLLQRRGFRGCFVGFLRCFLLL